MLLRCEEEKEEKEEEKEEERYGEKARTNEGIGAGSHHSTGALPWRQRQQPC